MCNPRSPLQIVYLKLKTRCHVLKSYCFTCWSLSWLKHTWRNYCKFYCNNIKYANKVKYGKCSPFRYQVFFSSDVLLVFTHSSPNALLFQWNHHILYWNFIVKIPNIGFLKLLKPSKVWSLFHLQNAGGFFRHNDVHVIACLR